MEKRVLIAVLLSIVDLYAYQAMFPVPPKPNQQKPTEASKAASAPNAAAPEPALRERAWEPFFKAAGECAGWRTERIVDVVASVLADYDVGKAKLLLESRPPTRFTRSTRARLSMSAAG